MNRKSYLELADKDKQSYFEAVQTIYSKLTILDKEVLLFLMCEDGTIKNKPNTKISFNEWDNKLHYSITNYIPDAQVGENNYVSGYKFNVLDNEKSN